MCDGAEGGWVGGLGPYPPIAMSISVCTAAILTLLFLSLVVMPGQVGVSCLALLPSLLPLLFTSLALRAAAFWLCARTLPCVPAPCEPLPQCAQGAAQPGPEAGDVIRSQIEGVTANELGWQREVCTLVCVNGGVVCDGEG